MTLAHTLQPALSQTLEKTSCQLSATQQQRLCEYLDMLQAWNKAYNLTRNHDVTSQLHNLIVPSLLLHDYFKSMDCLADLGTGAGIPGMILALINPNQKWHLIEKSSKKTSFLSWCCRRLDVHNVVIHACTLANTPQDLGWQGLVSRGSSPLTTQIAWTTPWRSKGCALWSIQTESSYRAALPLALKHHCHRITDPLRNEPWLLIEVP